MYYIVYTILKRGKKYMGVSRTLLELDENLKHEMKIECVKTKTTMTEFITHAIREMLDRIKSNESKPEKNNSKK
jgi:hypothetical protein